MNPIAQQALARALTRGSKPVPVADVLLLEQAPVTRPVTPPVTTDRISYLEGRRHATEIVRSAGHSLNHQKGRLDVLDKLRRSAVGKPPSFARGVAEIVELMEREVGRG